MASPGALLTLALLSLEWLLPNDYIYPERGFAINLMFAYFHAYKVSPWHHSGN
jgi:hypothetical protein